MGLRTVRGLLAIAALAHASVALAAESLGEIRDRLGVTIDAGRISLSGVSSGGFMANQFHLAHSAKVMGVGVLAAGPYACARGSNFWCDWVPGWPGFWLPHDSCRALHVCSAIARAEAPWFGTYLGPPGFTPSVETAVAEAAAGRIDPLANLTGDRVWLFSGTRDDYVPQEVVSDLAAFYADLFARAGVNNGADAITFEDDVVVAHAMVIAAPGPDNCLVEGPPFINDCSFDAAGELLTFIYGLRAADGGPPQAPPPEAWDREALLPFDQGGFFDQEDPSVSMNATGHIFVPERCRGGASCPLHVAFHGCRQHQEAVEQQCGATGACPALFFFADAGYNAWAQAHGIVVLYPQTVAWGAATDAAANPRGCWDWWGYSGADYFRRTGKQISAVNRMIDCLSGQACP